MQELLGLKPLTCIVYINEPHVSLVIMIPQRGFILYANQVAQGNLFLRQYQDRLHRRAKLQGMLESFKITLAISFPHSQLRY